LCYKHISGHHRDPTKERRRLVAIWDAVLEKVRHFPKFEHFLKPIPFHRPRQTATAGQVVIINISPFGADALVFDATHPIDHTPLPDIDSRTLAEMSGAIRRCRLPTATESDNKIQILLDNTLLPRRRIW
jgi:hypothetical protein